MPAPDVLLLDIMGTVVYDPYHEEIPEHFDMDLEELFEAKHPTAWHEFERGELDEPEFCERFFEGPRRVDPEQLHETLREAYRFIDGMERLLADLQSTDTEIHAMSNYPVWYRIIEEQLQLSRFLDWSFVSWETGVRKPDPDAYRLALETLERPAEVCLFVDDRSENCDAASDVGIEAVVFEDAGQLRGTLGDRGLPLRPL